MRCEIITKKGERCKRNINFKKSEKSCCLHKYRQKPRYNKLLQFKPNEIPEERKNKYFKFKFKTNTRE